ncbi:hypothetical protein ASPBRDRAFT_35596 [Aspergillus brasiliensis CBS 101740]|uniref:Cytochrome P450 n=1 Tax=Aspergillus brasiliensis (strain CBS 101740 / IMI 381727 / IBT 21946) TaxID=767769 RepID=A0A1L9U2G8_ASPBC|nr:hypothetical protein ASPBRDRAFT_35596 [Aspergillus brasiliensis CBS 101740]
MPKSQNQIKGVYYACCACLYVLVRYVGILTDSPLFLIGAMIVSWLTSLPLSLCITTPLRRHHSTFNDLPGPESANWLYDHVFDVFDEPLAKNVTRWINERCYPHGLMHFFGLFGSEYIVPTDPEGLVETTTRSHMPSGDTRLPVLNAMVMESLRLFPSFGLLLRKAIRDTSIKGRVIPRGTNIGICPKAINCARHIWGDDAEEFSLERWIDRSEPDNPKQVPTGGAPSTVCMLSFGYGTRSCVGRHLAMAQIKRQVALIVERFHVETEDDKIPQPSGMFASTPPLDFRLRFTELN